MSDNDKPIKLVELIYFEGEMPLILSELNQIGILKLIEQHGKDAIYELKGQLVQCEMMINRIFNEMQK